ncbi:MAG: HAD family hydrolase [Eubacteriales bacterium]|nr:HAD family hydrolase [Eubacteriales bacterium]
MSKKMILFDLDGTLWDSSLQVAMSWTETIKRVAPETHIVITKDFMHRAMGKVMEEIKNMMFEEASVEVDPIRQEEIYQACSDEEIDYIEKHGGVLYPAVEETLQKLSKQYKLGIVSNCQCGYIEAFLSYTGFEKYISEIESYGNTGLEKGDNIKLVVERCGYSSDEVVYVGDIMGDYQASMKAGVHFIHAAYGFGSVPEGTPYVNAFSELDNIAIDNA